MNQTDQEAHAEPAREYPAPDEASLWVVRPQVPVEDQYPPKIQFSYERGDDGKHILAGDLVVLIGDNDTVTGVGHFGDLEVEGDSDWIASIDPYTPTDDLAVGDVLGLPGDFAEKGFAEVADPLNALQSLEEHGVVRLGTMPMVQPRPTDFEAKLAPEIEAVINAGKPGYAWSDVDALIENELGLPKRDSASGHKIGGTRIKQAGGSSRGANVLKEGPGKRPDVYFVVLKDGYPLSSFFEIAVRDMEDNPGAFDVVAVIEKVTGVWRVTNALAIRPSDAAEKVKNAFPLVEEVEFLSTLSAPTPVQIIPPTQDALTELLAEVRETALSEGLVLSATTLSDAVSCCLASQFVLFAGPSGTGKSTLARLLGRYFTHPRAFSVIEARRQWLGPEDVVGYFSPLAKRYLATSHTGQLVALDAGSVDEHEGDLAPPSPILLIEEANLSPMDGYAPALIHGLSSPSVEVISWDLYPAERTDPKHAEVDELVIDQPPRVNLFPFPRVFGTINIDATAVAPARKVAGRAAVIIMEALQAPTAQQILSSVGSVLADDEAESWRGEGAGHLQDPAVILTSTDEAELEKLAAELAVLLDEALYSDDFEATQRNLVRSLIYMAYYVRVAADLTVVTEDDAQMDKELLLRRIAAENALLHFVLPTLSPDVFNHAVNKLATAELAPESNNPDVLGGMLRSRIDRLASRLSEMGGLAGVVDFWTALS